MIAQGNPRKANYLTFGVFIDMFACYLSRAVKDTTKVSLNFIGSHRGSTGNQLQDQQPQPAQ